MHSTECRVPDKGKTYIGTGKNLHGLGNRLPTLPDIIAALAALVLQGSNRSPVPAVGQNLSSVYMENTAIRFACNGCGVCCKGRLVPLTLDESRQWLKRGHDVAVILEAFDESLWPQEPAKHLHNARRAAEVDSGTAKISVVAIFAGNALTQCPNQDEQGLCGIYEERPLVCRIYPVEISPFVELNPSEKICPPTVWEEGEIIFSDRIVDPLASQVEQSRHADRADARAKVAICESMGMTVAAWKEDALVVYLPGRDELLAAIQAHDSGFGTSGTGSWSVGVEDAALRKHVSDSGIQIDTSEAKTYIFHEL